MESMTVDEYRSLFLAAEMTGAREELNQRKRAAQRRFSEETTKIRKRRRRKKSADEEIAELRTQILSEFDFEGVEKRIAEFFAERDRRLSAAAPRVRLELGDVEPLNRHICLDTSSLSAYRSQTAPHRYAEALLKPAAAAMEALGFDPVIRPVTDGYELWARCEPWVDDVISRTNSFEDISKAVGRVVNVCALYPGLPVEMLEEHYRITDPVPAIQATQTGRSRSVERGSS